MNNDPNPNPDTNPEPAPQPSGIGTGLPDPSASSPSEPLDFSSEDTYSQFVASLPDDLREKNLFKETKSLSALAKQALDAQSALGKKRLPVPQDDWGTDQWNDFYSQLRPESLDGYVSTEKHSIQLEGEDIKEVTIDEHTVGELRQIAHDLGLTPKQYQGLESEWAKRQVTAGGVLDVQINEAVQAQQVELREEWGADFALNHRSANEAFEALAQQVPELRELMDWSPIVANHPATMKLFHTLAPLIQDSGIPTSGTGSSFGQDTVAGIKAQIKDFDTENYSLLFIPEDKMATLTPADKAKREQLLKQRTSLYQNLYGNK